MRSRNRRLSTINAGVWRALVVLAAYAALDAFAAPRTFVAASGNDAGPCTLTQPCRGFAAAIAAVDAGGEVVVLDSAGYGPVTITKSVSLVAPPGVYAGVSVPSGDGVTINGAGIHVALKGLAINGQGGINGIVYTQGASLFVERCTVTNFSTDGIRIFSSGVVVVSASVASGNETGMNIGSGARVSITGTRADFNSTGIVIQGAAQVAIANTQIANNVFAGLNVTQNSPGTAEVAVDGVMVSGQLGGAPGIVAVALGASSITHLAVTRSTIARNSFGVYVNSINSGTTTVSLTDNDVVDSVSDGITANGPGTKVRAAGNRVMRNGGWGWIPIAGGSLYTPATNYVRDNAAGDEFGHTADTLQ